MNREELTDYVDKWKKLRKMVQDTIISLHENTTYDEDIKIMCGTLGRVLNMMEELENE